MIVATPTQQKILADFTGVEAHAGIRPEDGSSAIAAAAAAISRMELGRLDEGTTANVGLIEGGTSGNVVPGHCGIHAEARSLDAEPRRRGRRADRRRLRLGRERARLRRRRAGRRALPRLRGADGLAGAGARRGGAARRRAGAGRGSRSAAAATPTPSASTASTASCSPTAPTPSTPPTSTSRPRSLEKMLEVCEGIVAAAATAAAGRGVSGRLELRRGVVVCAEPLTVEVDGERRPRLGRHGAAGGDARGRRGRRQRRRARPRPRLRRLRRRPRQPDPRARGRRRAGGRARDQAQLHLAPAPGGPGRGGTGGRRRRGGASTAGAVGASRSLVLPLHGHLAPAAWAAGAGLRPGIRVGYVQTGGGALPGSLSRDVAELRERGLLCGHITAAPAYGGEHEALSTVGALDAAANRLGWDAVLVGPGPGIIGSDTEFGHGGMAALDSAHAALSLRLPTLLSPRLSSGDPRERHLGLSHHTYTVLELLLAPVDVAVPEGEDADRRRPRRGRRGSHRLRPAPVDLDAYAASGLPTTTMGRALDEDPLFFAAAARRRPRSALACVAQRVARRPAGRTSPSWRSQSSPRSRLRPPARAPTRASRASSSTSSPTWSWSAASRATRSTPTAPTSSSTASTSPPTTATRCTARPADVADFLAELATGDGRARPARPSTIHRKAACLRSFYKHLRRDELIGDDPTAALSAPRALEEAAAGPQLRRGAEAARRAARRASRRRCATGRCSR